MSGWPALGPDDESGQTIRVHPEGFEPRSPEAARPAGAPPHPVESPGYESQPSGPPYAGPSSGAPYAGPSSGAPYAGPSSGPPYAGPAMSAPYQGPPRHRSVAPLFMITVMVLTVVAGAVAVTYLLVGNRDANAGSAPAAAPSASVSASGAVDSCVIGDWQQGALKLEDAESGMTLSAETGGTFRLRADGTGEMDYGSGVSAKGTIKGRAVEAMVMGKELFRFTTVGGTFTYSDSQPDARLVVFLDGEIIMNELLPAEDTDPEKYTCSGDTMQTTSDGETEQYRRR